MYAPPNLSESADLPCYDTGAEAKPIRVSVKSTKPVRLFANDADDEHEGAIPHPRPPNGLAPRVARNIMRQQNAALFREAYNRKKHASTFGQEPRSPNHRPRHWYMETATGKTCHW